MTQQTGVGVVSKKEITEVLTSLVGDFIARSPFFPFWAKEGAHPLMGEKFLVSFDSLVKSFPALIAAGAARAQDEETRSILAVNLYQECGEGDLNRTHHAIYRKFLVTAGIDAAAIGENDFVVEWRARLSEYLQNSDSVGAVMGVLAAGEFLAQPVLGRIYQVLQPRYPQADQEYFTKHLELETEHVREMTFILSLHVEKEGGFGGILSGFKFGLSVWEAYFNRLTAFLASVPK